MYPPGPGALGMPIGVITGAVGLETYFWARSMACGSSFLEFLSYIHLLLFAFVPDGTRVGWERQFATDEPACYGTKSAAFALDSTCFTSLHPGITAVTAGFFRHQASAHCAIGTPGGTSSRAIRSTSRNFRSISSGF